MPAQLDGSGELALLREYAANSFSGSCWASAPLEMKARQMPAVYSGRKVSDSEKDQIKANLRAAQAPIAAKVAELGGQVENSFQSAYNGLRISIGRHRQLRGAM